VTQSLPILLAAALLPGAGFAQPGDKASLRLDRGIELAHAGKFAEAAQEFLAAVAINPRLAEAHYLLGLVRQNWGKWEDARVSYATALRLRPRYAEAQLGLAAVLTRQADQESLDAAILACRKAIELNPAEAEPHFHLATNYTLKSNFESAAAEYRATLRLRPDYPGARLGLANALVQIRDFDAAAPLLQVLTAEQPEQARVHHLLGMAASKQGHADAAVIHLTRAAALDPDNPQTRYILSTNLRRIGKTQEAEQELRRFRELTAGRANVMQARYHLHLAQKLRSGGKLAEAIGEYQESLSYRRDPSVAIDLGVALLSANRLDEAIDTLRNVSTEEPDSVLAHYHLGLGYAQKKDYQSARSALERSLQLRPEFPEALFNLGMVCAMQGQFAEAEKHLRLSIAIRPDLAPSHYYLGVVLRDLGRSADAEAEFLRARQLDPAFRP
jgi:Flp pilus assembly protein TadD